MSPGNPETPDSSACPLCSSQESEPFLENEKGYSLVRCGSCGIIRLDPIPSEDELAVHYGGDYYRVPKGRLGWLLDSFIGDFYTRRQARKLEAFKERGRLLDLGCGDGRFLASMEGRGWSVLGLDPSKEACEIAQERLKKGTVLNKTLEEARFPDASFDAVTLWQVLEHIRNPREVLLEVRRVLKPGGFCLISVPNIASIDFALFRGDWFHLDLPRHLYHYSPETLRRSVEPLGFEVLRVDTRSFGCPLSKPHSLGRWLERRFGPSPLASRILVALFLLFYPFFLLWNEVAAVLQRGETFTIICRKTEKA